MRFHHLAALVTVAGSLVLPAVASARAPSNERLRYNVVLIDNADSQKVARDHERRFGVNVEFVYKNALKGYGGKIRPSKIAAIEQEQDVLFVDLDEDEPPAVAAKPVPQPPQAVSLGVRRIKGTESSTVSGDGQGSVNVNVAVMDTGVQPDHPDLNVVGGHSCIGDHPKDFSDHDKIGGHGTLVSGFIGALDNAIGRVGIAPGARIYAVRALDSEGLRNDRGDHLRHRLGRGNAPRQQRDQRHRRPEHEPQRPRG